MADELPKPTAPPILSDRQRMFVECYLSNGMRQVQAAKAAGYRQPQVMGSRLANMPHIRAAIEARIKEAAMGADEVLARLAEQARASVADFFAIEDGKPKGLDWEAIQTRGYLIKSIKVQKSGPVIELYDAQAALVQIGRHLKLFTDQTDITSDGKPIVVNVGIDVDKL